MYMIKDTFSTFLDFYVLLFVLLFHNADSYLSACNHSASFDGVAAYTKSRKTVQNMGHFSFGFLTLHIVE